MTNSIFKLLLLLCLAILVFGCSHRNSVDSGAKKKMNSDANHAEWMISQGFVGQNPILKLYRIDIKTPISHLPFETVVSIKLKESDERGLPTEEEIAFLQSVIENLVKRMTDSNEGEFVYKQTYMGVQMLIFYTRSNWETSPPAYLKNPPNGYEFIVESQKDPNWKELMKLVKRHIPSS